MITKEEFDYIRAVLNGALGKGVPLSGEPGQSLRILDVAEVMKAVDGAWEELCPPALRPVGRK